MIKLYRANVAAILMREDGKILICERTHMPNAWQFPQGGIDPGEDANSAIVREIEEEVGFKKDQYEILQSKGDYRYDYPEEALARVKEKRKQNFVGQEQEYFLCRLHEKCPTPIIDDREFGQFRWIYPVEFRLSWLPAFKQDVYQSVFQDFFNVSLPVEDK